MSALSRPASGWYPDPSAAPIMRQPAPPHLADDAPPRTAAGRGWYPDPWRLDALRWWDGAWAPATRGRMPAGVIRPPRRRPAWAIWPILACAPLVVAGLVITAATHDGAVALGLTPLLVVLPCLAWAERGAPHHPAARLAALAWGATVAIIVALALEIVLGLRFSRSLIVGVAGPAIEEGVKGLGLWVAWRRREIESLLDGIMVAAWIAVGFAAVEDVGYFAKAGPAVAGVFVVRALLTPFAHPLFTMWIGAMLGMAAQAGRRRPLLWAVGGWAVAAGLHMGWNEALLHSNSAHGVRLHILLSAIALFVGVFAGAVTLVAILRRRAFSALERVVPWLAGHYGLSAVEATVFADRRAIRRCRRSLASSKRPAFDAELGALGQLAQLWDRRSPDWASREPFWADRLRSGRET